MSTASEQYAELELQLLVGRMTGSLQEAQEDVLLERMDETWWEMSPEEHRHAEARVRSRQLLEAPESLELRDCSVRSGDHQLPRQAA